MDNTGGNVVWTIWEVMWYGQYGGKCGMDNARGKMFGQYTGGNVVLTIQEVMWYGYYER